LSLTEGAEILQQDKSKL